MMAAAAAAAPATAATAATTARLPLPLIFLFSRRFFGGGAANMRTRFRARVLAPPSRAQNNESNIAAAAAPPALWLFVRFPRGNRWARSNRREQTRRRQAARGGATIRSEEQQGGGGQRSNEGGGTKPGAGGEGGGRVCCCALLLRPRVCLCFFSRGKQGTGATFCGPRREPLDPPAAAIVVFSSGPREDRGRRSLGLLRGRGLETFLHFCRDSN